MTEYSDNKLLYVDPFPLSTIWLTIRVNDTFGIKDHKSSFMINNITHVFKILLEIIL